jgi:hypothetical protein
LRNRINKFFKFCRLQSTFLTKIADYNPQLQNFKSLKPFQNLVQQVVQSLAFGIGRVTLLAMDLGTPAVLRLSDSTAACKKDRSG